MNKTQAKAKFAQLFARCWGEFDADDIGRAGPFDYADWLEWAEQLGLLVCDEDGTYELAPGVKRALPSLSFKYCDDCPDLAGCTDHGCLKNFGGDTSSSVCITQEADNADD